MSSTYEIKLPQFEGPFDLLLFFIERDELDIYDIPIARITDDFLAYLHQLEMMNLELASEFILVASTLMRIKARMLLPRKELDEEGNEIDPREELVQKLLEYKQFKDVVNQLQDLEEERSRLHKRGNTEQDLKELAALGNDDAELQSLTLYQLYKAFNRVLQSYEQEQNKVQHTVVQYPYTITQQKQHLKRFLKKNDYSSFVDVFQVCENRVHAIFTFLALLEMIQQKWVEIKIGEGRNNFWLKLN